MSHPVDVQPAMHRGPELPLENGKIACITCHDAAPDHPQRPGRVGVRVDGGGLCLQCHQHDSTGTKAAHALSLRRAHLKSEKTPTGAAATFGADVESRECMSCHDGTTGRDAGSHRQVMGNNEFGAEHPIGVRMRFGEQKRDHDFGMATRLDRRVRLFDGMVGCGTCHSPYSRQPGQLVMSNRGSALCLSCHTQR